MRDIALFCTVIGLLPVILARPWTGVLVWSWIGYMNPHRLTWGFAWDFPFAMLVAATLLVALVVSREPKRVPWTRETIVLVVFTAWMFISTIDAQYSHLAWTQWDKVWKIQLMTLVTLMLITTRERLDALIWVIVLSLGFYGVKGGVFTVMTGGQYLVLGPEKSFIAARGAIAMALNMTIPLMRYLQLNTTRWWIRHGLTVAMVLTALAVLGTHSRGGLLGLVAMGAMLLVKTRRTIIFGLIAAVAVYQLVQFMPEKWTERMESLTTPAETAEDDPAARNRINAWWFGYHKALEEPLTGGGFEVFVQHGTDFHSIWFETLGEQGFVGFGLYMMLWLFAWRTGSLLVRVGKRDPSTKWLRDLGAMVQTSLVAYAAGGSFLGLAYFDLFYHLVAVLVIGKTLLWKYEAEVGQEEPSPAKAPPGQGWSGTTRASQRS